MNLKLSIIILFVLPCTLVSYSQNKTIELRDIEIYKFTSKSPPDSLDVCGGEWILKVKSKTINDLNKNEIKRIKKKVAKYGCPYVFVDINNYYNLPKDKIYILGLKRKEN